MQSASSPVVRGRDNFDVLRLAISVLVLARHCMLRMDLEKPWWWWIIDIFPGVPMFFVISGFLVSSSFERSSSLPGYAMRRLRRILPGLWACVLLTILVATLFGFDFLHASGITWTAAQFIGLIYTPEFLENFGSGTYNGSLWTIPVSLQFYALLPLIYLLVSRMGAPSRGIAVLWGVSLVLALVFRPMVAAAAGAEPVEIKLLRYSIVPHLYLFLTGVLLQRLRIHEHGAIRGKAPWWLAGYVALMYLVPETALKDVIQPLALGLVALSLAFTAGGVARGALRGNDLSYGVFIYHGLVINVFVELGLTGSAAYAWGVAAATFFIAFCSWHFIESPFLGKKRQTAPRHQSDRTATMMREKNAR